MIFFTISELLFLTVSSAEKAVSEITSLYEVTEKEIKKKDTAGSVHRLGVKTYIC